MYMIPHCSTCELSKLMCNICFKIVQQRKCGWEIDQKSKTQLPIKVGDEHFVFVCNLYICICMQFVFLVMQEEYIVSEGSKLSIFRYGHTDWMFN